MPGLGSDDAAYVRSAGSVYYLDDDVDDDSVCIRPALWINLGF